MAERRYSRLANVQNRRNVRSAYLFGFLTIVVLVLLFVFGLPLMVRFADFLGNIRGSSRPIEVNDKTPPAPPRFDNLPDFTKESRLELSGSSESGAKVEVFVNGDKKETTAGDSGEFTFSISFKNGENELYGIATDRSGNTSTESRHYSIIFDNKEPILDITSPQNGQSFSGSEKQIEIKGKTEELASVTVNERLAIIDDEGNFTVSISLEEGTNNLEVKSVDRAGNETTKSISVNYTP